MMLIGTINAFFDLAHVPNLLKKAAWARFRGNWT